MKKHKLKGNKGGFTLIETLVAVTIFAFAITGLISITATGVFNTNFVKNKFTAGYLALEGAELVRNVRDSAALAGENWGVITNSPVYFAACFDPDDLCQIDADIGGAPTLTVEGCGGACDYMNYNLALAQFNHAAIDSSSNPPSIFTRTIRMETVDSEEVKVISTVDWTQGSGKHEVTYVFNMLNWSAQ